MRKGLEICDATGLRRLPDTLRDAVACEFPGESKILKAAAKAERSIDDLKEAGRKALLEAFTLWCRGGPDANSE